MRWQEGMNLDRSKIEVRRRVMALQADVAGIEAAAFARVVVRCACVLPIDHLVAVDPGGKSISLSHENCRQEFVVMRGA